MAQRRGVSVETPHVSFYRRSLCRSRGGESVMCHLDRPRIRPLIEAAAVGVLGPTAHLGLPLKVFLGVGRC
jgi:hypothetical protein